jgi:hypothetical protein
MVCCWVELSLAHLASMREMMAKAILQEVLLAKEKGRIHAFLEGMSRVGEFSVQTCYCFAVLIQVAIVGVIGDCW